MRLLMLKNSAPSLPLLFRPLGRPMGLETFLGSRPYRASFTAAQSSKGRGVWRRSLSPGRW